MISITKRLKTNRKQIKMFQLVIKQIFMTFKLLLFSLLCNLAEYFYDNKKKYGL